MGVWDGTIIKGRENDARRSSSSRVEEGGVVPRIDGSFNALPGRERRASLLASCLLSSRVSFDGSIGAMEGGKGRGEKLEDDV